MHGFSPEIQIFIICFMVLFWVVGVLAAASTAFNCYLAFSSRRRKPWLVALSAVVSAVSAGALTVGGFTLHPNAPYDKNWSIGLLSRKPEPTAHDSRGAKLSQMIRVTPTPGSAFLKNAFGGIGDGFPR